MSRFCSIACALLCLVVMIWLGAASDKLGSAYSFTGTQIDYYNLLVSGFRKGHLYLDAEVSPARSSPDPAVQRTAPTLLDASFYKGRYYLYYGVVPAVLVLLPYTLITGQSLSLNVPAVIFWAVGFAISLAWFRRWTKDYNITRRLSFRIGVVLLLGFGPAATFLVRRSMFYELPLVAGYTFIALAFYAIYEWLQGRKGPRALALASLSVGLAVGCHPNHVFLLIPLAGAVLMRRDSWSNGTGEWRRVWSAAVLPAAAVGVLLAWYNYARFANPLEFGFNYGENGFFSTHQSVFQPKFIGTNFRWYFLIPPTITPYFPFVFPGNNSFLPTGYYGAEQIHGQYPFTILFLVVLAIWLGAKNRRVKFDRPLARFAFILIGSALLEIFFIGSFIIRANRYMVDFQTPLTLLVVILAGLSLPEVDGQKRNWGRGIFTGLAIIMAGFYVLASIQQFESFRYQRTYAYATLSRLLNIPFGFFYRFGAAKPGPVKMTIHLTNQKTGVVEPLIVTGIPYATDGLYLIQHPGGLIGLQVDHFGYGGPRTDLFNVDLKQDHTVEFDCGALYPPRDDPYFKQSERWGVELRKTLLRVKFDGKEVINQYSASYDAPPWARYFGENLVNRTEFRSRFSGSVGKIQTLPVRSPLDGILQKNFSGVFRLQVEFPTSRDRPQPLLSSGASGDGYLILTLPAGGNDYVLRVDDWGYGFLTGEKFTAEPGRHTLDMVIGPLVAKHAWPSSFQFSRTPTDLGGRLFVWIDGKLIGDFPLQHHLTSLYSISFGRNWQGFSSADTVFAGELAPIILDDESEKSLVERALSVQR